MVDFGAVMGALGLTAGIISLVYTRIQVRADRTQAEEATRASRDLIFLDSGSRVLPPAWPE